MTGIYYTDLVDVLAAAGVRCAVEGVNAGWETRARSSGGFPAPPLAVFWHHSASSTSPQNDLSYMIDGSDDAPVGNMLIDRDGTVWPVAAGASNCAGKGGPMTFSRGTIPLDSGNTKGFQIEAANNGVGEPWPQAQIDTYFVVSNTLNAYFGNLPEDVTTHAGWTTRKIDPAVASAVQGPWQPASINSNGTWSLLDIRNELTRRQPPPSEDDMTDDQARQLTELHSALVSAQPGFPDPSGSGGNLNAAWAALWGQAMIANNVLPLLVAIQNSVNALAQ